MRASATPCMSRIGGLGRIADGEHARDGCAVLGERGAVRCGRSRSTSRLRRSRPAEGRRRSARSRQLSRGRAGWAAAPRRSHHCHRAPGSPRVPAPWSGEADPGMRPGPAGSRGTDDEWTRRRRFITGRREYGNGLSLRDPCESVIPPRGMAMGRRPWQCIPLLALMAACGKPGSPKVSPTEDAGSAQTEAASVTLPALPLGMAEVSGFAYRTRAGHASFRAAREAEKKGDWAKVADRVRAGARGGFRSSRCRVPARGRTRQARPHRADPRRRSLERSRRTSRSGARRRSISRHCRRFSRPPTGRAWRGA